MGESFNRQDAFILWTAFYRELVQGLVLALFKETLTGTFTTTRFLPPYGLPRRRTMPYA